MHVPTAFYARFARDASAFADRVAEGRFVSVLEGGYSNRAIISGVMAHMAGLATAETEAQEDWWSMEQLAEVSTSFHLKGVLKLKTPAIDREAFEEAAKP